MMSFSCVLLLVALAQAEHPGTFTPSNNYEHHDYGDISGYKCPAESKVNKRAPKAPYTCPSGSDPAVVIKWGFDKKGANIYQSFGKTSIASYRKKKMCGTENGRYVTGAPNDPYPQLSVTRGSDNVNSAIKNKKVVRIMGHVRGLMCSRMRPRLNVHLNPTESGRQVIMPNTWEDENNNLGSALFSIQAPCLERDGSDGRAASDSSYDGRNIDYLAPSGSKSYGTCSLAPSTLGCHRSPDFDTGDPANLPSSIFSSMDGLIPWNPAGTNVFKLELHCGDAKTTTVFASGVGTTSCQTRQEHWIRVDKYKYKMQTELFTKKSGWACKCARPRNNLALGGVTISGWGFGDGITSSAVGTLNTGVKNDICPAVSGYQQCHVGYGAGTSGCGNHGVTNTLAKYKGGISGWPATTDHLQCTDGAYGSSKYVDRTSTVAQKCVHQRKVRDYSHWMWGCPEWAHYGGNGDRKIRYGGHTRDIQDFHWWHPRKNRHFTTHYNHHHWGWRRLWAWGRWGHGSNHYHFYLYTQGHTWGLSYLRHGWRTQLHVFTHWWWGWHWHAHWHTVHYHHWGHWSHTFHHWARRDQRQRCHYHPGIYRVLLGDKWVCDRWQPQHYVIQSSKDWRTGVKYQYRRAPKITHHWTKSTIWRLMPKNDAAVIFPIAEVEITLCTKEWVCPAGTWKDGSSCKKCAAGKYRTSEDPETSCLNCDPGFIEQGTLRDSRCFTECPEGKYCLAGSYEGSSNVKDCPAGRYCPKGSSSDSKKCHAGFVCYKNSIDGQGRAKKTDEVRKCEAGYYCAAGASSTKQAKCQAGYYCPVGTATQQKCSEDSKKRFSKYCLIGQAKPTDISDGYRGTGWSASRKTFSGAPVKCDKGQYCNKATIEASNVATGMPQNNKCAKGRIGWSVGNKHDTCDAECPEGYFCDLGTDLRWPANTDALKKSWAKISCGAGKDTTSNKRYAATYAANVYCPGGTTARLTPASGYYSTAPGDNSGSILNCRTTPGKKCPSTTKCCWRAAHGHDDDSYIKLRVGQKKCEDNYVCVNGVRAPTLEFAHFKDTDGDGNVDTDATDSCGGETWKEVSAMVATPNDAILGSVGTGGSGTPFQFHYLDTRVQKISLKIDTRVPATVKYDDGSFNSPIYSVIDDVAGSGHWQGEVAAQNANELGIIRLVDGKAIRFPTKGGSKTRLLTITSKREFKNAPGIYIKTLKPCKLTVTLRNSNDRPTVPANQVRSIEEWSPKDALVQTPIQAEDPDEGQGFIFTLLATTRLDDVGTGRQKPPKGTTVAGSTVSYTDNSGKGIPFQVGRCSGIIKVKNDVLRYDYDNTLNGNNIFSGIRQYQLRINVMDKDTDDQEFEQGNPDSQTADSNNKICDYTKNAGTDTDKSGYCQKRSEEALITVDIKNRNDPPYAVETTSNDDFTIGENSPVNTKLTVGGGGRKWYWDTSPRKYGRVYFTDPDYEDTHTFRIVSMDDHDAFKIDSTTGQLSVKKALDFEKKAKYRMKISITDSGGWKNIPLSVETWITITVLDENDAPTCATSMKGELDEELAIGTVAIKDLGGEDIDAIVANQFEGFKFNDGDATTSSDGDFKLVLAGGKWQLQAAKQLNFEALDTDEDGEYKKKYKVYAYDKKDVKSSIMTLSIEVNDVNEIPANFVPYTIHVNENEKDAKCCLQSDNTKCNPDEVIGGAGAAAKLDPDQDQSLKYEFTVASDCDDGGASLHTDLFKIDESSGLIKTKEALDFEKTGTYTLRVKAKDTGSPAQEKCVEVTVAVVDIDEAPTVKDSMDKDITVGENKNKDDTDASVFTTEGEDLDAGDKDKANQNIKYEIHAGNDDGYFGIDADTGIVSVVVAKGNIDYEDVSKYELTIRTSDKDDSKLYTDENIKVTVNDENENPEIDNDEDDDGKDTGGIKRTVTEDSGEGTNVGAKITCSDPDESDSADDGGCTSSCEVTGHLKAIPNSDGTAYSLGGAWSVGTVTDVFELDNMQIKVKKGATVPVYVASDDDSKALYVQVKCTDEGDLTSGDQTVLVEIEEYNEEPEIDSIEFNLFENTPKGTKVGTKLVARDDEVDLGTQSLTFSITKGNKDGYFKIDANTGQLSMDKGDLDYEAKEVDGKCEYILTVTVEDDDEKNAKSADAEVKIIVIDINEAPGVYKEWSTKINENSPVGTKVGDPVWTDTDGARRDLDPDVNQDADVLVDKFTSGNDDGIFEIDSDSQITIAKASLDFESKSAYKIDLRVKEPENTVAAKDYRGTQFNTRKGHVCQAWGEQTPHKHIYTIEDYPDFGLDSVTVVVDGVDTTYTIHQGVCRDPSGRGDPWCYTTSSDKEWDYCDLELQAEIQLTIDIEDTNEAPSLKLPKAELTIDEDASTDENVGKPMIGDDEDENDEIEYKIVDGKDADGRFKIDKSSGQIKVAKESAFDFEATDGKEHTIEIECTDNHPACGDGDDADGNACEVNTAGDGCVVTTGVCVFVEKTIIEAKIRVVDVNEKPTIANLDVDVSEDLAEKKTFAKLSVSDEDKDDDHTCKIIDGNENSAFALSSAGHEFSINNGTALDFEGGKGTYNIDIECTDGGGLEGTAQVTITLTDSNENPTVQALALNVEENAPSEMQLAKGTEVTIEDQDNSGEVVDHTLSIVGGDPQNMFKLEGRAIKIGNRGWLHKIDEDGDEYKTPQMRTSQSDHGSSVTCPNGEVVSFGFKHHFTVGSGNNFAKDVRMVGASHIKESVGKLNAKMQDSSFRQLTLGYYGVQGSFGNAGFSDGGVTGTTKRVPAAPWEQTSRSGVYVVASGDNSFNSGLQTESGANYYVALKGRNSVISQKLTNVPVGAKVTLSFGLASKTGVTGLQSLIVNANGAGATQVFPDAGGLKNPGFHMDTIGNYKYGQPFHWKKTGNIAIVKNGNGAWGGLFNEKTGAMYYASIQNTGSAVRQTVSDLPLGAILTLNFHGACRPGYGEDEKLKVHINGVLKGTYACSSTCGSNKICPSAFHSIDIAFSANSDGKAIIEFYNDSPSGVDRSVFVSDPNIRLPSAGTVVAASAGSSCADRCADDGMVALSAHTKTDAVTSDVICQGGSTDQTLNAEYSDTSKYTGDKNANAATGGCCKCGDAPAFKPFDVSSDVTSFRRHTVTFKFDANRQGNLEFEFINNSPDKNGEIYLDSPQVSWREGPGPTSDANIEIGLNQQTTFVPTKMIVSPVTGTPSCGTMVLESCGSWDANSKKCQQYHTVASFEQSVDFKIADKLATPSRRWRISPLTSLPVHWSGYKCAAGTDVGASVNTAKECQAKCEAQETCTHFSFNTEGENADSEYAGAKRCILSTDAQCVTKTAAKYVTYKKPKVSTQALDFPSSPSKKYVRISSIGALNSEFSVSFWLKPTSASAGGRIISKQRSDGTGWNVRIEKGQLYFSGMSSADGTSTNTKFWGTPGADVNVGQWHHVVATFSKGGKISGMYIDGGRAGGKHTVYDVLATGANVVTTLATNPVVIGREWDETDATGWTSSNKNLQGGRKLYGVRLASIAVYEEVLTADNAQDLFEGSVTAKEVGNQKILVLVDGVRADGTVEDGSGKGATMSVRHKNDGATTSTETKMSNVEDNCPTSELVLASSNLKTCGMSINIQAAVSQDGDCIYDSNKHCVPGLQTCEQTVCDTPGDDEARVWALCQPEDTPMNFLAENSLSKSTNHVGQELSCPDGTVIGLGFAIQSSNDRGTLDKCFAKNNKECKKGQTSCSQELCDTPGDDIQTIYLWCQPSNALHASPVAVLTSSDPKACAAGIEGKVCNDVESGRTVKCKENAEILFGFGLHHTSNKKSGVESSRIKKDMNTVCKYGSKSCSLPYASDTQGADTTMVFAICAGALNYEVARSYELIVETTDPLGLTGRGTVTVTVTDKNEQPRLDDAIREVKENSVIGVSVGDPVEATDPDANDLLFYTITGGDGADLFYIMKCTGQIHVKQNVLNYETKNYYNLSLSVVDDGKNPDALSDTAWVSINIVDVNEAPVLFDTACTLIEDNEATRREMSFIRLAEGDSAIAGRLEYNYNGKWGSVCSNNFDDDDAKTACRQLGLTGGTVESTTQISNPDPIFSFGNQCDGTEVSLRLCTNGVGAAPACDGSNEENLVSISCTNPWPKVCSLSGRERDEDAGDTGTWMIVSGNPGSPWPLFVLDAETGDLAVSELATTSTRSKLLDHEEDEVIPLVIRFTDAGKLSSESTLNIIITDTNEAPHFKENPFPETRNVDENAGVSTAIGSALRVLDPDDGDDDGFIFSLDDDCDGIFKIDPVFGLITVARTTNSDGSSSLDFETKQTYTIVARVTDPSDAFELMSIPVQVNDINEAPVGTPYDLYIREDAEGGDALSSNQESTIGQILTSTDEDAGSWGKREYAILTQTYDKWDNEKELNIATATTVVKFDAESGTLELIKGLDLNYEKYTEYSVKIRVKDGGNLYDDYNLKVHVIDINEPPVWAADESVNFGENSAVGATVHSVTPDHIDAADEDKLSTRIVSITGGDGKGATYFSLKQTDSDTVNIQCDKNIDYEYLKSNGGTEFVVTLEAKDDGIVGVKEGEPTTAKLLASHKVTIKITDQNDPPEFTSAAVRFSMPEDEDAGKNVGLIAAVDQDKDELTYTIRP